MTPDEAKRIIARHCLARLAENVADDWGLYPEIGEFDWEEIVDLVQELAPPVDAEKYEDAYLLLEARAERE